MEYLSRHHQEHCRLNKDGGNEAESGQKTMNLGKMINYLFLGNQLIIRFFLLFITATRWLFDKR